MNSSSSEPLSTSEDLHPDPITGEPGAHPAAVGVGALSAGVAGAAIGAFAGPIGAVVGAAIGAITGGVAGHEVAATHDEPAAELADSANPEPYAPLSDDAGLGAGMYESVDPADFAAPTSEELVREKAYYRYLTRVENDQDGDDVRDWYAAERETRGKV